MYSLATFGYNTGKAVTILLRSRPYSDIDASGVDTDAFTALHSERRSPEQEGQLSEPYGVIRHVFSVAIDRYPLVDFSSLTTNDVVVLGGTEYEIETIRTNSGSTENIMTIVCYEPTP